MLSKHKYKRIESYCIQRNGPSPYPSPQRQEGGVTSTRNRSEEESNLSTPTFTFLLKRLCLNPLFVIASNQRGYGNLFVFKTL